MNMTYQYKFATGDVNEVEISSELWKELTSFDEAERRLDISESGKNRKAGRHIYIESLTFPDGNPSHEYMALFADGTDMLADIIEKERSQERTAEIKTALSKLPPKHLELLIKRYIHNQKAVDIAKKEGVSEAAISQRIKKIRNKLKKYL